MKYIYAFHREKTLWEKEKCWLPAFSPFPIMFLKGFFLGVVLCLDCVVKNRSPQLFRCHNQCETPLIIADNDNERKRKALKINTL